MDAKELRIGNILLYDETIYSYGLKKEEFTVDAKFILEFETASNNGDSDYFDMIKPIPITEEWLLRFGFKKLKHAFYIEDFKVMINQLPKGATGHDQHVIFKGIPIKNINEVHRLQNLFFELKEKELQLKELVK